MAFVYRYNLALVLAAAAILGGAVGFGLGAAAGSAWSRWPYYGYYGYGYRGFYGYPYFGGPYFGYGQMYGWQPWY